MSSVMRARVPYPALDSPPLPTPAPPRPTYLAGSFSATPRYPVPVNVGRKERVGGDGGVRRDSTPSRRVLLEMKLGCVRQFRLLVVNFVIIPHAPFRRGSTVTRDLCNTRDPSTTVLSARFLPPPPLIRTQGRHTHADTRTRTVCCDTA